MKAAIQTWGAMILCILIVASPSITLAQKQKHWLALAVVTEYRAAPIYMDGIDGVFTGKPGVIYSIDDQLTGLSAGVDLRKNIFKERIEGGYGIRFRYGHLLFDDPGQVGLNKSVNAWTTNHLLFINGRFPVGENREVRLAIGHAFMNRGSSYAITQEYVLPNGQTVSFATSGDFRFVSDFASLSYNVRGLEGGVIVHYADETDYFNPSPLVLLCVFLKYDLWK